MLIKKLNLLLIIFVFISNVNAVAGNATNINAVAGNSSNILTQQYLMLLI